jgi:hypothetical protein
VALVLRQVRRDGSRGPRLSERAVHEDARAGRRARFRGGDERADVVEVRAQEVRRARVLDLDDQARDFRFRFRFRFRRRRRRRVRVDVVVVEIEAARGRALLHQRDDVRHAGVAEDLAAVAPHGLLRADV